LAAEGEDAVLLTAAVKENAAVNGNKWGYYGGGGYGVGQQVS
jgi:hypothetical protein